MELKLYKIGDVEKQKFEFMDRQSLFPDLVAKVEKPPKKIKST